MQPHFAMQHAACLEHIPRLRGLAAQAAGFTTRVVLIIQADFC